MAKKKKFKGMSRGVNAVAQMSGGGFHYLKLPKGFQVFKAEEDNAYRMVLMAYEVLNIKKHPDSAQIDDIWYRLPFSVHNGLGTDGKQSCICRASFKLACPICEEHIKLSDDPDTEQDIADKLRPSSRFLYYPRFLNKKNKMKDDKYVWNISWSGFEQQLNKEVRFKPEHEGYANLEDGKILEARFIKKKFPGGSFAMCDRIDFKERDDIDPEEIEDYPPLEDLIIVPSYDQASAVFMGMDEEDIDNEEPEEDTEEREEVEDKKPKKDKKEKKDKKKDKKKEPTCPEDYEFGTDFGTDEDDCDEDDCDLYEECKKANKALKKEKKKDKKEKKEKKKEPECPHGYTFGDEDDFDENPECAKCEMYNACEEKVDED